MKANYPVEFLAASMTLDMGNTDKLVGIPRRGAAARHQGRAALDQPLRRRLRGRRQHHPLRARRAQGRRPAGGRGDRRRARRQAVRRSRRLRPPRQSARRQQARAGKPRRRRRVRRAGRQPRARLRGRRYHARDRAARATRTPPSGQIGTVRRPGRRASRSRCRRLEPWLPAERLQTRVRRHRLLPLRPSARRLRRRAQAHAGAVVGRVRALGEAAARPRAASPAPWCRARSGAPRPATRWASSGCPIRPATTRR